MCTLTNAANIVTMKQKLADEKFSYHHTFVTRKCCADADIQWQGEADHSARHGIWSSRHRGQCCSGARYVQCTCKTKKHVLISVNFSQRFRHKAKHFLPWSCGISIQAQGWHSQTPSLVRKWIFFLVFHVVTNFSILKYKFMLRGCVRVWL